MRTVVLEIAGSKYRLTTDSDEGHLRELAEQVNARIESLGAKAVRSGTPAQLLAVVALGLAEELEEAKAQHEGLKRRAAEVVADAIGRIDGRLAALARLDEEPAESAT
ncbi:MAG: cell division protein ZapA [Myxococcales bacterium]|nr:cell division protein ZapA [Myxococcales bacterium]